MQPQQTKHGTTSKQQQDQTPQKRTINAHNTQTNKQTTPTPSTQTKITTHKTNRKQHKQNIKIQERPKQR